MLKICRHNGSMANSEQAIPVGSKIWVCTVCLDILQKLRFIEYVNLHLAGSMATWGTDFLSVFSQAFDRFFISWKHVLLYISQNFCPDERKKTGTNEQVNNA